MGAALAAFGRNDLIGLRRDPLLRMLVIAPFVYGAIVRFPVPPLTDMLQQRYGFDLVPYYPLIVSLFLVLGTIAILGSITGLMLLEEKETGTLVALRVSPAPLWLLAAYRAALVVAVNTGYVAVMVWVSGLVPLSQLGGVLASGLCAGFTCALLGLAIATVARNKVEGLAILRAAGIVLLGLPVLPYFFGTWEWVFGLLPSYWPAKIFWVSAEGGNVWPYLLAGVAYNAALCAPLLRAFARARPQ
ncbi:fluoroquinolones efflux ABC transporter permease [Streptomonospora sediminis]